MAKLSYSSAILRGAMSRGWSEEALATAINVRPAQLKRLLTGKLDITDRQVDQIEHATGLTGGQLAAKCLEPKGGAMTEITNLWAEAVPISQKRKQRPKPKGTSSKAKRARV